jgi:hypothetical protein
MKKYLVALLLFLIAPAAWADTNFFSFVPNSPSLPVPPAGTDTLPVVRSGVTYRVSPLDLGPVTADNANLAAAATTAFPNGVWRLDYAAGNGAPPLFFKPQAGTCAAASMVNDGGSCVDAAGGGSWKAAYLAATDIRQWGLTSNPINLYVSKSGSDNSGGNSCVLSGSPCLTIQQALTKGLKFDVSGGNLAINFQGTGDWAEDVFVTNPLTGAANKTAVPNIGTVWPSMLVLNGNGAANTTISGTGATCATIAASNHAIISVENLTLTSSKTACADTLFAQLGGGINVFGGNIFGASGASGCKMHAENSAYGIQIWENYTLTGNGNCGYSVGGGASTILISAGVGTITGSPTIAELVFVSSGGVFQTNIANPWGGSPGTLTGAGFLVAPGGVIETNGLGVVWPGNGTSYLQGGSYDDSGNHLLPAVTSDAGIGAGSVAIASGSSPYSGAITMTAGAGPSATGVITVTFPTPVSVRRPNGANLQCTGNLLVSGTGTWANGAAIRGNVISAGAVGLVWNNSGTNLTNGQTYAFSYTCIP